MTLNYKSKSTLVLHLLSLSEYISFQAYSQAGEGKILLSSEPQREARQSASHSSSGHFL